jgi:hypothetical protein
MPEDKIVARIDPAYQRLIQLLQSSAAGRTNGHYELKVVVCDGAIKAAFVKTDENVALLK